MSERTSERTGAVGAGVADGRPFRLGTGVLVLPLADPLAVAEDAAVLDELSGGRVELGVGSGPFPTAWEAFGRSLDDKHALFDRNVARLHEALEGRPLNTAGEVLHPSGIGVRRRLWQATTSDPARAIDAAIAAAGTGDGLQLSRAGDWAGRQSAEQQADIVASYREAAAEAGYEPRAQVSRAVYPHPDSASAVRAVTPGVSRWQSWGSRRSDDVELSVEEYLERDGSLLGPAGAIAESLAADPSLAGVTDLLVTFVPGVPEFDEHIRLLTATAREVAPPLGWHPLREPRATMSEPPIPRRGASRP